MKFALGELKECPMCKHRYILIKTKVVKIGTHFSTREVTTEFYECLHCGLTTSIKKENMIEKFDIPLLTILDNLN